jgi:hypothetical protein
VGCKKTNQPAYGYLAATVFGGMLTGLDVTGMIVGTAPTSH